jgi:hypothetical protein
VPWRGIRRRAILFRIRAFGRPSHPLIELLDPAVDDLYPVVDQLFHFPRLSFAAADIWTLQLSHANAKRSMKPLRSLLSWKLTKPFTIYAIPQILHKKLH